MGERFHDGYSGNLGLPAKNSLGMSGTEEKFYLRNPFPINSMPQCFEALES
jgi:hypothetical protein